MFREITNLCLFIGLLLTAWARADDVFDSANAAYEAGDYPAAAEGYEELLNRDGPRVSLLQNLGSAYHRMGKEGRAILSFERALLLKPGDADLAANLELSRDAAAVFPLNQDSNWDRLAGHLTRRQWSGLALVAALLLPIAAGLWWWRGGHWFGWSLGLGTLLLLIGLSLWEVQRRGNELTRGFVVSDEGVVRVSPFATAEPRGTLSAGREVTLGAASGDYYWVEDGGGSLFGWMSASEVEALIPELP